jgi:hypothetical protein
MFIKCGKGRILTPIFYTESGVGQHELKTTYDSMTNQAH